MPAIRKAQVEDAAQIATVQVASWKSTYKDIVPDDFLNSMDVSARTLSWQEQISDPEVLIFVAEDEEGVFGFIAGGKLREPYQDYDAELYAIYLLSNKQRQGAGRRLTQALITTLVARGFKSLLVWVLEQNPAVSFYRKLGGVIVAHNKFPVGGVELPDLAIGWPDIRQLP